MESDASRRNKYGLTGVWQHNHQYCFDLVHKGRRVHIKGFQVPYQRIDALTPPVSSTGFTWEVGRVRHRAPPQKL